MIRRKNMTLSFIATIEYYDVIENNTQKDYIALQAPTYAEAVAAIEDYYGDDLEGICDLHAINDVGVIHLGKGNDPEAQAVVDTITKENGF
jgi:hypothetical protein